MSSTFRRIGEELFKSLINTISKQEEPNKSLLVNESSLSLKSNKKNICNILFESDDPICKILSCLIVLRTLNQGKKS